ncbi:hypothetical protein RyT2_05870 [Pseudolactococcus yaeyamensis]
MSFTAGDVRDNALELRAYPTWEDTRTQGVKIELTRRYLEKQSEKEPYLTSERVENLIETPDLLGTGADVLHKFYELADSSENALEVFEQFPDILNNIQAAAWQKIPLRKTAAPTTPDSDPVELKLAQEARQIILGHATGTTDLSNETMIRIARALDEAFGKRVDDDKYQNISDLDVISAYAQDVAELDLTGAPLFMLDQKLDTLTDRQAFQIAQALGDTEVDGKYAEFVADVKKETIAYFSGWSNKIKPTLENVLEVGEFPKGTDITPENIWRCVHGESFYVGANIYDFIKYKGGVDDTITRENLFKWASYEMNLPYANFYNAWLDSDSPVITTDLLSAEDNGAYEYRSKLPHGGFIYLSYQAEDDLPTSTVFVTVTHGDYQVREFNLEFNPLIDGYKPLDFVRETLLEAQYGAGQITTHQLIDKISELETNILDDRRENAEIKQSLAEAENDALVQHEENDLQLSEDLGISEFVTMQELDDFSKELEGLLSKTDEVIENFKKETFRTEESAANYGLGEEYTDEVILSDIAISAVQELRNEIETLEQSTRKDDLETKSSEIEETNWSTEFLSSETKGGLIPDSVITESHDASVTSAPTLSPHLPQFTMTGEYLSNNKQGYKVANASDINFLNEYLSTIQEAAQFYDEKMKDEIYHYVTVNDAGDYEVVPVRYGADNFAHSTGVSLVDDNRELPAKDVLKNFVEGNFEHQAILVTERDNYKKKIEVLGQLKDLSNLESLYMKDFSQVKSNIKFDDAFKTQSDEMMLAMRDFGNEFLTPYSLMNTQKDKVKQKYQKVGELRPIVAIFDEERTQSGSSIGILDYNQDVFENLSDMMELQKMMFDVITSADRSSEKLPEHPKSMQVIFDELEQEEINQSVLEAIEDLPVYQAIEATNEADGSKNTFDPNYPKAEDYKETTVKALLSDMNLEVVSDSVGIALKDSDGILTYLNEDIDVVSNKLTRNQNELIFDFSQANLVHDFGKSPEETQKTYEVARGALDDFLEKYYEVDYKTPVLQQEIDIQTLEQYDDETLYANVFKSKGADNFEIHLTSDRKQKINDEGEYALEHSLEAVKATLRKVEDQLDFVDTPQELSAYYENMDEYRDLSQSEFEKTFALVKQAQDDIPDVPDFFEIHNQKEDTIISHEKDEKFFSDEAIKKSENGKIEVESEELIKQFNEQILIKHFNDRFNEQHSVMTA